jgi:outer membrane protein, heavy metal efflux system
VVRPARAFRFRHLIAATAAALGTIASLACASARTAPTERDVAALIEKAGGYAVRVPADQPAIPPDVSLADGLSADEAVAIALWNSPAFQERLADLGIARAEVVQAGLLRNPVLTLLLPWGPKQLEATAKWPLEAIWQRPRRLAAARASADAVASRLVADGLDVIASARIAFVDLRAAEARAALTRESTVLSRRFAELAASRLAAGDISQLEADVASVDAASAAEDDARAAVAASLARDRLIEVLAIDDERLAVTPLQSADGIGPAERCRQLTDADALASRPDLRAAELEIEAAGLRLGWERSRIFSLVGVLDANAEGKEGFELGPGVETDFGLFDRNQAGVLRATAEMTRSQAHYRVVRQQILREVRDARARLAAADTALARWRGDIRPRLERQADQTERAYAAGEFSYLNVVEALRRLNTGRTRELEAETDLQHAIVDLEKSIGYRCAGGT